MALPPSKYGVLPLASILALASAALVSQTIPNGLPPWAYNIPDKVQPPDSGVIDHVAFGSRGFEAVKQHLTQAGVPFRVNQVPNSARWQIFLTDPNNVLIELNFDVANESASASP